MRNLINRMLTPDALASFALLSGIILAVLVVVWGYS
jgi:hypothetical protein